MAFTSINSFADDLCANPTAQENASRAVKQIQSWATNRRAPLAYDSSTTGTCNPMSTIKAAYPNTSDGAVRVSDLCGPIFTFSNQVDLQNFVNSMKYTFPDAIDVTCTRLAVPTSH